MPPGLGTGSMRRPPHLRPHGGFSVRPSGDRGIATGCVLTGVSREQMQRAGRALQATRERHLQYRRELFDIPLDDERVTLIVMDEDWQTAQDRIRRQERSALPTPASLATSAIVAVNELSRDPD